LMGSTAMMLEESILATQQQKSAADQVATAMVQIRESADQLAAEQEQRVGTAERVEELVGKLEETLAGESRNGTGHA
jgi:methyl-accepting chemotaxis protein